MVATSAPVELVVGRLSRRIRLLKFLKAACWSVAVASVLNSLLMLLDRFLVLPFDPLTASPVFFGAGLIAALVFALASHSDTLATIRLAEDRLGLKERLSTSVLLAAEGSRFNSVFVRLQQRDADMLAPTITPGRVLPMHFRREAWFAALGLLLFSIVVILTALAPPGSNTLRAEFVTVSQAADTIDSASRKLARTAPSGSQTKAIASEMAKLAQKLRAGASKQQASAQIQKMSNEIARRQAAAAGQQQPAEPSDPELQQVASGLSTQPGGDEEAHRILSEGAQDFQKTQDPHSIAVMLRKLADELDATPMTPGDRQATSHSLDPFSTPLRQSGNDAAANDMAKGQRALRAGDQHGAAAAFRRAADDIDKQQADAQGMQDAQQSLANAQQRIGQSGGSAQSQSGSQQGSQGGTSSQSGPGGEGQHAAQQQQGGGGQAGTGGSGGQGRQQSSAGTTGSRSISQSGQGGTGSSGHQGGSQQGASGQNGSSGASGGQGSQSQSGSNGHQTGGGGAPQGGGAPNAGRNEGQAGSGSGENATGPQEANHNGSGSRVGGEGSGGGPIMGAPQPIDAKGNPDRHYNQVTLPPAYSAHGTVVSTGHSQKGTATGPTTVPYYNVYPAARKTAESSMSKQTIPTGYKRAVEKYFNDIAPTR